jgi:hypothetical protein
MSDATKYSYETRLNVLYKPLEIVDTKALADACNFKWYNQTLCQVNESVVRLGVVEGEYHWHKHDEDDEFFYVVEGQLLIDLEGSTVELHPGQGFVVPSASFIARAHRIAPSFSCLRTKAFFPPAILQAIAEFAPTCASKRTTCP